MAHGLVEATGRSHYQYNPDVPDTELYEQGYNRVYDTLEPEQNLDDVERVMAAVLADWDHSEVMCSYKLNHAIGEHSTPIERAFPSNQLTKGSLAHEPH